MSEFPIGSIVRLYGLVAKPEMNGKRGTVRSFVEETGRYGVEIIPNPGKAGDRTIYTLRTQNFTVVETAKPNSSTEAPPVTTAVFHSLVKAETAL